MKKKVVLGFLIAITFILGEAVLDGIMSLNGVVNVHWFSWFLTPLVTILGGILGFFWCRELTMDTVNLLQTRITELSEELANMAKQLHSTKDSTKPKRYRKNTDKQ